MICSKISVVIQQNGSSCDNSPNFVWSFQLCQSEDTKYFIYEGNRIFFLQNLKYIVRQQTCGPWGASWWCLWPWWSTAPCFMCPRQRRDFQYPGGFSEYLEKKLRKRRWKRMENQLTCIILRSGSFCHPFQNIFSLQLNMEHFYF